MRYLALLLLVVAMGCQHDTSAAPIICTTLAAPALMVSLADSASGATTGFTNVSFVAVNGTYSDSVFQATYPAAPFNGPVAVAYEHRGTYQLTVRADTYAPWVRSGIVVTGDACHVTPVPVTARLVHVLPVGEAR